MKSKDEKAKRIDHDGFSKAALEDFAGEFFEAAFPDVIGETGKPVGWEFLKEEAGLPSLSLGKRLADTVIRYEFEAGEAIVVLAEAKSDRRDFDPKTLCLYFVSLLSRHPGAEILPLVFVTDQREERKRLPEKFEVASRGRVWLRFEYRVFRLGDLESKDHLEDDNRFLEVFAPLMKHARSEKAEVHLAAVENLEKRLGRQLFGKYVAGLEAYVAKDGEQYEIYREKLKSGGSMILEEIREEGREEGLEKGREEGMKTVVLQTATVRFGKVTEEFRRLVEGTNNGDLLELNSKLLFAESLDDLLSD